MHTFIMINALICINNYVITCMNSMLSARREGGRELGGRAGEREREGERERGRE